MRSVCVIDNSTLITLTKLYHLSIFEKLSVLFERIHIPLKVKEEYEHADMLNAEPIRLKVLSQMRLNSGFLSICSKYDTISHAILKTQKGIDAGEAEAAAQHTFVHSQFIISDDKKFIAGLKLANKHIKVFSTLHLIAWLDVSKSILNAKELLMLVRPRIQFNPTMLRSAYEDIYKHLGILPDRKIISEKTSLKALGLK